MLDFYKKAFAGFITLILFSIFFAYFCVNRIDTNVALLPSDLSEINWQVAVETDAFLPGNSRVVINDAFYSLDVDLTKVVGGKFPSAAVALVFQDDNATPKLADLSEFSRLSFSIKCSTPNVLVFMATIFDEKVSDPDNFLTYRSPSTYLSCDQTWNNLDIDLTDLHQSEWWLTMFNQKLSMNEYPLDKVARLKFGTTEQSPMDVTSRIQIGKLILHGTNWSYMYILVTSLLVLWCAYAVWIFKQHTSALVSELKDKILRERPLIAYRQINLEPQRDKDKDRILHYMATAYANPDLNLDTAVAKIGVSRNKINDLLKAELGLTFVGYLNKIRLTEAVRLLTEKDEANVAEIAYSVGYKNVSYFNKLFKEEYGCTPKAFKSYIQ
jgi:AraC-like DNA-binding protein